MINLLNDNVIKDNKSSRDGILSYKFHSSFNANALRNGKSLLNIKSLSSDGKEVSNVQATK
jgi:hypothetical protein